MCEQDCRERAGTITWTYLEKHCVGLTCVTMVSQFSPICFYKGNPQILSPFRRMKCPFILQLKDVHVGFLYRWQVHHAVAS